MDNPNAVAATIAVLLLVYFALIVVIGTIRRIRAKAATKRKTKAAILDKWRADVAAKEKETAAELDKWRLGIAAKEAGKEALLLVDDSDACILLQIIEPIFGSSRYYNWRCGSSGYWSCYSAAERFSQAFGLDWDHNKVSDVGRSMWNKIMVIHGIGTRYVD
jgi:hypothetical protein